MSSIRRRLTIGLALALCLLWAAGGLALYLTMRRQLMSEFDRGLETSAQALVALTSEDQGAVEMDFSPAAMPAFSRAQQPDYFQIWLPDGSTGWRSPSLGAATLGGAVGSLHAPTFADVALPDGGPGRTIGIAFVPRLDEEAPPRGPRDPGPLVKLVFARNRGDLDRRLGLLATAILVVGVGTALATILLVPFVVRRGLRPLDALAARAEAIDARVLDVRFPTTGIPAELRPICERLNELLGRLQASFDRERRFSADVAHELRTPIAELRASSETALKWPEDTAATARALQDAVEIAVQMESITAGLLALARCEAGLQSVAREPVDIATLLDGIWRPLADRARPKRLAASWDVPEGTVCIADPALLRLLLTNLLGNAVEYSPPGTTLHCRATIAGDRCRITVSNQTHDVTAEDLPHLFERFWRKDAARTGERSGLGLALARAFADAMGMEIKAELPAPDTLSLTVTGPAAARTTGTPSGPATTKQDRPQWVQALLVALSVASFWTLQPRTARGFDDGESIDLVVAAGRPLRVALDERLRVKRIGQPVTATVVEPVYAYDRIVVPAGAKVLGRIEKLERVSAGTRLKSMLAINFSPARRVALQFDRLVLEDGREVALATRVGPGTANVVLQTAGGSPDRSLVGRGRDEVARKAKQVASITRTPRKMQRLKQAVVAALPFHPQYLPQGTVYDAELLAPLEFGTAVAVPHAPAGAVPPPESILNARLTTTVDSAGSPRGTAIEAVLTQPLFSAEDHIILPEGTTLTGEVTFARAARRLRRNGQLRFLFASMRAPEAGPEALRASLYSAEASRNTRLAIDDEGGATISNPGTRFVAPAVAAAAVGASFLQEPVTEPGQIEPGVLPGAMESNSLGTGAAGYSGLGLLGLGLSQLSRQVAVGLGFAGLARSLYVSFLGKGRDVSFPAGTRIQVQLAPGPTPEPARETPSTP